MVDVRDRLRRRRQYSAALSRRAWRDRGETTITAVTDPARERRDYVLDAWADTAVTVGAVAAAAVVATVDYFFHPEGVLLKVIVLAVEVGTAALVIDHVAKMVWYRTFIGTFLRWLGHKFSSRRRDGGRGGPSGGSYANDQAQQQDDDEPRPRRALLRNVPQMYLRSWTVPVVESSGRMGFALAHPKPGSGSIRAAGSVIAMIGAGLIGGLVGGLSSLASRASADPVPVIANGGTIALTAVVVALLGIGLGVRFLAPMAFESIRFLLRLFLTLLLFGVLLGASVALLMAGR